ncbi:MAG TPA: uroporphyrinogen-III synthase [Prolixibacteraceae bacterium]|nr:uroporphyrinogen-III synthase [Prolixibacteraceae bacterium]
MKIKSILVTQPEPNTIKSPYSELAESTSVKIDFRPFIQVEGVSAKEFRQTRIHINDFTAVLFNSKTAIDHFFRLAQELRVTIPDSLKYFCISESTAFYLQKYIVYRKRKIFHANGSMTDLLDIMKKHKEEFFLVPLSDIHSQEIPKMLDKGGFKYTQAILYRTISSDLKDLKEMNYDILVFFSPSGIKSLIQNFPDFKQNDIKIACFGSTTAQAVREAGFKPDIEAPTPEAPSMTMALEHYIKNINKTK